MSDTQGFYKKAGDTIAPAAEGEDGAHFINWMVTSNLKIGNILQLTAKTVARHRPDAACVDAEDYCGFVKWPDGRKTDAAPADEGKQAKAKDKPKK